MSVRLKTILGIAIIEGLLLVLLVLNAQNYLRESNQTQFIQRANTTASLFANATKNAVIATDIALLESFVNEVLEDPDLIYARVRGQGRDILAEAGDERALQQPFTQDLKFIDVNDDRFDVIAQIEEAGIPFGQVELGFSSGAIASLLQESRRTLIAIALMEMLLVALFSYLLGTYLTRQLTDLKMAAVEISRGNFDISVPEKGQDELAHAAAAFNTMAEELSSSELLRTAYMRSPVFAIITLDLSGTILEVNAATEILLLESAETLLGTKIHHAMPVASETHPLEHLFDEKDPTGSEVFSGFNETEMIRSNGDSFYCEWQISRIEGSAQTLYVIYASNIDLRKQSETDLIQARISADSANQAKSEFLANMTHELRTPLQGIIGFSELGVKKSATLTSEKSEKYFSTIKNSADTLLSLVNNLLDLTKLESGKMNFQLSPSDLIATINELVSEFSASAALKGCSIQLDVQPNTDPSQLRFRFDHERVSQVLRNLLGNALKHAPENSNINVLVSTENTLAQISVRDFGKGIPAGEETLIFERFAQSSSCNTGAGGTGLGLSICSEIVTRHGGTIWAANAVPTGAQFTFTLDMETTPAGTERKTLLAA